MSYIQLTRDELIWETRQYTFDKVDWDHFIERQKDCLKLDNMVLRYNAEQILKAVEGKTFEDIVADFQRWDNGESCICVQQMHWYSKEPTEIPFADLLRDEIREYVFDSDVIDSNYADDYEERLSYGIDRESI